MSTCAERMAASPAAVRTKGLEMAQLVRVLACKPGCLSSSPRHHIRSALPERMLGRDGRTHRQKETEAFETALTTAVRDDCTLKGSEHPLPKVVL